MKIYLYILSAICLLPSCEKTITEFQAQNFIKFFGGGTESKGNNVIVADPAESSYLFVGYDKSGGKNKIMAVKTDKFGNTIWENVYEKDSIKEESAGTLIKKAGNGFIIVGTTQVNPSPFINPKLMKINQYGDIVWKSTLTRNYDLIINDFIITGSNIIVAGESYESGESRCYYATINTVDTSIREYSFPGTETFKRVFLKNNGKLIFVGNSSISGTKLIILIEANISGDFPDVMAEEYPVNEQIIKDAIYKNEDGSLYLLIDDQTINKSKVIKYAAGYTVDWTSADSPPGYSAESLTLKDDGTLFILCEYDNGMTLVKVDSNGDLYSGNADFKNLPGDAGAIISTPDDGLIIIGSTASTFGTMAQLIKTDKDLYLLKP